MVTAELATALPVLVLVTFAAVSAVGVAAERIRCADGAREAARAVARGDSDRATALASAAAGRPVEIGVTTGELSRVSATLTVRPLSWLPGFSITQSAVVATEPGAPP